LVFGGFDEGFVPDEYCPTEDFCNPFKFKNGQLLDIKNSVSQQKNLRSGKFIAISPITEDKA